MNWSDVNEVLTDTLRTAAVVESSCSFIFILDHTTNSLVSSLTQVRKGSRYSVVVVVSESRTFLATLANWSLKGRLLVWATRMLVVTRLTLPHLHSLLSSHWTFSMMNTVFLNLEQPRPNLRCNVHTWLPYSPEGHQAVQLASWIPTRGFIYHSGYKLFLEKYVK
ncbi:hypothetical protein Pmani_014180 [Petrolisthes manimaculis]|uniref:Uncharacterized protein n=1 Tax=Petrolisthes manimaculis TaxID=1843537 RepID=A0AAE1PTA1_9EUCA|nr:hypothetical protein Pmani_014180 [Petrolisthes manimaculis]